ncbi:WD40-repeat-containing domain protein [Aspergillus avenaceus]|uniref:WD40-repeat-containing domain protein n=1 Tax=Aspergillus avenaceus TaxID=36643 RepID=A0A5N6TD08_ASPAV|nr:WD40-repeat-containing domain protein [Aspergillus avenaceus]
MDAAASNASETDPGISAIMALPQSSSVAPTEPERLGVTEVVNAVMDRRVFFRRAETTDEGTTQRPSSPPSDLYMSDSEMTDALSDMGGVPLGPYENGPLTMGPIVHQLIENATARQMISTISEDTEDEDTAALITDYDPPINENLPTPVSERNDMDEDAEKFYSDDDNSDREEGHSDDSRSQTDTDVSDLDYEDFYRTIDNDLGSQTTDLSRYEDLNIPSEGEDWNAADLTGDPMLSADIIHGTTHEKNLNVDQFLSHWLYLSTMGELPAEVPALSPTLLPSILGWDPPAKVARPSRYQGDFFDVQQIPWWEKLRVKRKDARMLRDRSYSSYHNLEYSNQGPALNPSREEFYFREKSMYTKGKATIEHFQLRNLMSVANYNTVHFAQESKVYSWVPAYDDLSCLIDLSRPCTEYGFHGPVKISTMKSAHNVAIAGGFSGEYAVRATGTQEAAVAGFVTMDPNGITNHIDVVPSRTSRSPRGIFASNDRHLRVLDCETNTFIADHELSRAINCTATSPDGRLRVVIGDSPDAWVVEADTGRPVHPLRGHRDFGFACAWSPDMRHIATSNQDKTVIIWDARTWRVLAQIESDVAGYRSVRYSPVGGGPRTLLLCEPADRIAVVNAQTYQTRQVHDFFGEVGGADYSPDGSTIWVANTDEHFGGFMEYERRQWGQRYGVRDLPNEWVRESELDDDDRCVLSARERQMRFWWNLSDDEHEGLLLV